MKNKLLTISIAAYNVEKYLEKALESIVIPEYMDKLEVFIIDDGSQDSTGAIAQEYEKRWKNTFHYIKKKNEGYGSTVNWSVKNASGEFFKLLDGDDSFNKEGLKDLLDTLEQCNVDAIVSQAVRVYPDGRKRKIYTFLDKIEEEQIFGIEQVKSYADVAVWGYTYRTSVLKKYWKELPLNSFYTDRILVAYAIAGIKKIMYKRKSVYKYRVGLQEQSTSKNSICIHYKEALQVDRICVDFYSEMRKNKIDSQEYMKRRIALYYASTICMLLTLPRNEKNKNLIVDFEREIREKSPEIYRLAAWEMKRVRLLRWSGYLAYDIWGHIDKFRNMMVREK